MALEFLQGVSDPGELYATNAYFSWMVDWIFLTIILTQILAFASKNAFGKHGHSAPQPKSFFDLFKSNPRDHPEVLGKVIGLLFSTGATYQLHQSGVTLLGFGTVFIGVLLGVIALFGVKLSYNLFGKTKDGRFNWMFIPGMLVVLALITYLPITQMVQGTDYEMPIVAGRTLFWVALFFALIWLVPTLFMKAINGGAPTDPVAAGGRVDAAVGDASKAAVAAASEVAAEAKDLKSAETSAKEAAAAATVAVAGGIRTGTGLSDFI